MLKDLAGTGIEIQGIEVAGRVVVQRRRALEEHEVVDDDFDDGLVPEEIRRDHVEGFTRLV